METFISIEKFLIYFTTTFQLEANDCNPVEDIFSLDICNCYASLTNRLAFQLEAIECNPVEDNFFIGCLQLLRFADEKTYFQLGIHFR